MRIALVYDCLYPNTIGGAERWYRNLGERLAGDHQVDYLTRRQWAEGDEPQTPFRVVAVSPGGSLYDGAGRRRIGPPLRFGWGVFRHLLRHGRDYDAVHVASFPYFSLLGARLALTLTRSSARLVVDWHELWAPAYWRAYLGAVRGRVAATVQALCVRCPDRSFTFSRLVAGRLAEAGHRAPVTVLRGQFAGPEPDVGEGPLADRDPLAVFAGRHVPEKRVLALPAALAEARRRVPGLRAVVLGDGPQTESLRAAVAAAGLDDAIDVRGRVEADEVAAALTRAAVLVHPSEREGYGLAVVEAIASGTPAVLVAGPENAATELIEPGVNGFVAASAGPHDLGEAIAEAFEGGGSLRASTLAWYEEHRRELGLESSLEAVERAYSSP